MYFTHNEAIKLNETAQFTGVINVLQLQSYFPIEFKQTRTKKAFHNVHTK